MNKAEKFIGEMCAQNAKNKDEVAKYLGIYKQNRYEKRKADKQRDYFKNQRHDDRKYNDECDLGLKK